jgi:hypothetical protein
LKTRCIDKLLKTQIDMKKIVKAIQMILGLSLFMLMTSCNEDVAEFGFDGAISGMIKDQSGNFVAGDITSTNLRVMARGEGDNATIDMRVKGDGTYGNTKLYPKKFEITVSGPVTLVGNPLQVDFSKTKTVKHDFVVIPFVTAKPPVVVGSPKTDEITISYETTANEGRKIDRVRAFCSTNPYPNGSTGDGPYFHTKTASRTLNPTVDTATGNFTFTGLKPGTRYHIRIEARAGGQTLLNFSDQIIVSTPGN